MTAPNPTGTQNAPAAAEPGARARTASALCAEIGSAAPANIPIPSLLRPSRMLRSTRTFPQARTPSFEAAHDRVRNALTDNRKKVILTQSRASALCILCFELLTNRRTIYEETYLFYPAVCGAVRRRSPVRVCAGA